MAVLGATACGTQVPAEYVGPRPPAAATAEPTPPARQAPTEVPTPAAKSTSAVEASARAEISPPVERSSGRVRVVDASRLTADDGWVLTHRSLLVTHDSGGSWTEVTPPDRVGAIVGVHFPSPEEGYVAENKYDLDGTLTMHHTSDGGASWQSLVVDPHDYILPLRVTFSFPTAKLGFAAVRLASGGAFSYASLLRTMDSGATWEVVGDAPAAAGVTFLDASTG